MGMNTTNTNSLPFQNPYKEDPPSKNIRGVPVKPYQPRMLAFVFVPIAREQECALARVLSSVLAGKTARKHKARRLRLRWPDEDQNRQRNCSDRKPALAHSNQKKAQPDPKQIECSILGKEFHSLLMRRSGLCSTELGRARGGRRRRPCGGRGRWP